MHPLSGYQSIAAGIGIRIDHSVAEHDSVAGEIERSDDRNFAGTGCKPCCGEDENACSSREEGPTAYSSAVNLSNAEEPKEDCCGCSSFLRNS